MNSSAAATLRCWAEIDTGALRYNAGIAAKKAVAGGKDRVIAVIKADGYGHGLQAVARALAEHVAVLAVASVAEAGQLCGIVPGDRVLLLSPALPSELPAVIAGNFTASLSNIEEARALHAAALATNRKARVNAVLDTGMGRMGALPADAAAFVREINSLAGLELISICSHYSSADEDAAFTSSQEKVFHELSAVLPPAVRHIANSAAILGRSIPAMQMVRAGLMLYGVSPLPHLQAELRPAMAWKTRVGLVRELPAGWGVSYGRTCILTRPTLVATLTAGYGDGYPRHASGKGAAVLIGGKRCPVLGRITMDQIMVDASSVPLTAPGEEAVLLGCQGAERITAHELAGLADTIPWHLFTGITTRTVRLYL